VFLTPYVNRPALPASFVAFSGGMPLFAGDGDDAAATREVEIALSGQYKTRDFTLNTKNFEEMIKNHADSGVDPAVDREHESWFGPLMGGGGEARGWVKSLDIKPAASDKRRSALVAKVELNDLGVHAVKNKHFRYVSIGYDRAGKNRASGEGIGHVLDHLALVKRPFIEGMNPLSLSLSATLGRPVEQGESNMDEIAKQLRTMLGLAADAPEGAIIAALAKRRESDAAAAQALTALDEQKRVNARLEAELTRLSQDVDERASREWCGVVDQAAKDYRLTPAEADEHKTLTGAERAVAARLLAKRQPNKPAGADVGAALTGAGGDRAAADGSADPMALSAAQREALSKYEAAHPGMAPDDVFVACVAANPALFPPQLTHSSAEGR
jgi:hypothetical protein